MDRVERVRNAMLAIQRYPWEQGVCAQALFELGDETWICMAHDAVLRKQPDGRLAVINENIAVTDPAANGEVVFRAYEKTKEESYLEAAQQMLSYLKEKAPRNKEGILYHNEVSFDSRFSEKQFWVDSAYMAPPFLAIMGEVEDAMRQIRGLFAYLQDPETGVLFHIYDEGTKQFVRKLRWATGNGWALMGIARMITEMSVRGLEKERQELIQLGTKLLDSMLVYRQPDGRFLDIMDDPDSFSDGTSAMMMSVFIYRGIAEGYLSRSYLEIAQSAYATVSKHIDAYGILHEVCGCPDFVKSGTSAEAQASYLLASAWREKVLQNS